MILLTELVLLVFLIHLPKLLLVRLVFGLSWGDVVQQFLDVGLRAQCCRREVAFLFFLHYFGLVFLNFLGYQGLLGFFEAEVDWGYLLFGNWWGLGFLKDWGDVLFWRVFAVVFRLSLLFNGNLLAFYLEV